MDLKTVLTTYSFDIESVKIEAFGSGLINHTWRIVTPDDVYILQRINDDVFKKPEDIAANISLIANHLREFYPEYLFVSPTKTRVGEEMVFVEKDGYFRMFPFVKGSHSKDVVATAEQAYEAAAQFGKFTKLLRGVNVEELKTTIPHFHDLSLRYKQFLDALKNGNRERVLEAADLIHFLTINDTQAFIISIKKDITDFSIVVCNT